MGFAKKTIELIDARDGLRCVRCLMSVEGREASRHHRKLRSQGGPDSVSNAVTLCGSGTTGCHGHVHHNRAQARAEGYILSAWGRPAVECAIRWCFDGRWGWALLDDQGGVVEVPNSETVRSA